jgi:hypothetical protein
LCRRIRPVAAAILTAECVFDWQAISADRRRAAPFGNGLLGVAGSLEPALLAERSKDCEAKASIERADVRMPVASVRTTGTGNPEPA